MQNLHNHKSYSNVTCPFKDSHMSYEDYAKRAIELGQRVLSSVEHGWQGNYLRCFECAKKYDLKYVFGVEAYYVRDRHEPDRTNGHILILARNLEGVYEINEMLSTANEDGFYVVPRVDPELLKCLTPSNVLVTSACIAAWGKVNKETGGVNWHYAPEDDPGEDSVITELILDLAKHFGASFYLEVQAHNTEWQRIINRKCLDLHYRLKIPLIAGLDSHYIYPEQFEERKYLREESGIHVFDEDHEISGDVYEDYPDDDTVVERFLAQGVLSASEIAEAMENTDVSLTFDDIEFDTTRKLPTIYPGWSQDDKNSLYESLIWGEWNNYKANIPKVRWTEYEDAIRYETDIITSTGTADYFLLDNELVCLAEQKGGKLTPTGRGSAPSFLTNMLLHLTTLDRLKLPVKLYPERFVTADRLKSSLPDADLNVSDPEPFAEAQEELLGKGHAYPMISYGTLKTKSAFKLYARANNLPADIANEVSKQIDKYENAVRHAEEDEKELVLLEDYVDPEYIPYIEGSAPYLGIVVSKSQAPCGYLLYNGDIRREIGIVRVASKTSKKTSFCTVIDGYTAEAFGYVKNDRICRP